MLGPAHKPIYSILGITGQMQDCKQGAEANIKISVRGKLLDEVIELALAVCIDALVISVTYTRAGISAGILASSCNEFMTTVRTILL